MPEKGLRGGLLELVELNPGSPRGNAMTATGATPSAVKGGVLFPNFDPIMLLHIFKYDSP